MRNKTSSQSSQRQPSGPSAKPRANQEKNSGSSGSGSKPRAGKPPRRSWSDEQKQRIVDEGNALIASGTTVDATADQFDVARSVFRRWRKEFATGQRHKRDRIGRSGLSVEQKKAAVLRELRGQATPKEIAAEYNVTASAFYVWKKLYGRELANGGGANLPVPVTSSNVQRVTVIPAAKSQRARSAIIDAELGTRQAHVLLNNAARDLDDIRPADLDGFQLKVLLARDSMRGGGKR